MLTFTIQGKERGGGEQEARPFGRRWVREKKRVPLPFFDCSIAQIHVEHLFHITPPHLHQYLSWSSARDYLWDPI